MATPKRYDCKCGNVATYTRRRWVCKCPNPTPKNPPLVGSTVKLDGPLSGTKATIVIVDDVYDRGFLEDQDPQGPKMARPDLVKWDDIPDPKEALRDMTPAKFKALHECAWTEDQIASKNKTCYQCDKTCGYLFPDGRCGDCTRYTPEEIKGDI